MRRTIFFGLGLLELTAAILLVVIGLKLPGGAEVREGFGRVEGLTGEAGKQVALLRDSQDQVLGNVAQGMEAWANALDPAMIRQLRQGTAELAAFLQEDVAPAASRSAGRLEKAIGTFQKDAILLSQILKDTPPDLKAAKEIHDSLGKFGEGIDKVSLMISEERLKTMREGFKGMEKSLDTGAEQIERLAGFTYPVVKFNGLKPEIDEKSFWPDGEDIAKGMRKGAKAIREAGKELDTQAANLPHIQKSLDESRKTVSKVRDMLGDAVKNQDKLEKVLASLPRNTAQLADDLPLLAKDLSRVLRETERLKDISSGLKQAETLLASAEKSWPEARQGLLDSAAQLRAMKKNDQGQQAQGLDALGSNLKEIHDAIPSASQSVVEVLTLIRWLLWVVAAAVTLHGAYLLLSVRASKPQAA
jgi:uncharacterized phage infection (PIP) family protein YhgE